MPFVYSTNPDFMSEVDNNEDITETPAPSRQRLKISIDRRNRGGKQVTLVRGFMGREDDLLALGKVLKNKCGTGGSVKNGEIIIQGDFRNKLITILKAMRYGVERGS